MAVLMYIHSIGAEVPLLLWLALAVLLYLTVVELRPLSIPMRQKAWWFSLVLLAHVFGYIVLRAYVFFRRRAGLA